MARALNVIANVFNFIVALLLIAAAGLTCWAAIGAGADQGFRNFVVGVFVGIFGIVLLVIEIWVPYVIKVYAGFLVTFLGRGLWLIFLGFLIIMPPASAGVQLFFFIAGLLVIASGLLFCILQFFKACERPKPVMVQVDESQVQESFHAI